MPIYNALAPFTFDGAQYNEGDQIELVEEVAVSFGAGLLQPTDAQPTQPPEAQPEVQNLDSEQPAASEAAPTQEAPASQEAPAPTEEPAAAQAPQEAQTPSQETQQLAEEDKKDGWAGNHKV